MVNSSIINAHVPYFWTYMDKPADTLEKKTDESNTYLWTHNTVTRIQTVNIVLCWEVSPYGSKNTCFNHIHANARTHNCSPLYSLWSYEDGKGKNCLMASRTHQFVSTLYTHTVTIFCLCRVYALQFGQVHKNSLHNHGIIYITFWYYIEKETRR